MRKSRFTDAHIFGTLKEHEACANTANIGRQYGNSAARFCKFKGRDGPGDVV